MERGFGSFSRAIPLSDDANTEKVAAAYQNGVITVTIPKVRSPQTVQKKGTKIEIK